MISQHNQQQTRSSDPSKSVWVSASAGTGKTKILTDRVLKLLLSGIKPQKILCLTFTKAAANEMLERINQRLINWTKCKEEELSQNLALLLGRPANNSEKALAKSLFYMILHSAEQIQIQTIHGFCQSIIRQFPFEAGITPGFKVIDELKSNDLIRKVSHSLFINIDSSETVSKNTSEALTFIATNIHDTSLEDLQSEIISNKVKFKILIDRFNTPEQYEAFLRKTMQINRNYQECFDHLFAQIDAYGRLLLANEDKDDNIINKYNNYYALDNELRQKNFALLKLIFLTTTDTPRAKIISTKSAKANPDLELKTLKLQDLVAKIDQELKSLKIIEASKYLFILANELITNYELQKNKLGYIDYDDLIYLTRRLLANSEFKEWVLYKLDGGIDHILIDEAQDTSPQQWRIIESLMQEFYAGGENNRERTVFVVGDEKQSIYSFQGADTAAFKGMREYLASQMQDSQKPYEIIDLTYGYRSTEAIITFVHTIFEKLTSIFPGNSKVKCFRANHPGKVEIWPLVTNEEKINLFWPLLSQEIEEGASTKLAHQIAKYIHSEISSARILPSTGKPISAGDFMILIRRRNSFTNELIKILHEYKLEIAGIDRLIITDNIIAQDLIALAKFVLQPLDNLNLAALLKSPFFGIDDAKLQTIILSNKQQSIWQNLHDDHWGDILTTLNQFRQIYLSYSVQDFFHIILDVLGFKKNLLEFGGEESLDVIHEFLDLSSNFAKEISTSLQEFVLWIEHNSTEIKRNVEKHDKIRIMTIHGSKGLQSGIVILADTTSTPTNQNRITWTADDIALWTTSSLDTNNYLSAIKNYNQNKDYEEYLRLLYVAMTRAEDYLIVTGYINKKSAPENSWYQLISKHMQEVSNAEIQYSFLDKPALIYQNHGDLSAVSSQTDTKASRPLPNVPKIFTPIIKSPPIITTNAQTPFKSDKGMIFGRVFHKIMEDMLRTKDFSLSHKHQMLKLLESNQQSFISNKIESLIKKNEFQELLKFKIYTEVNLGLKEENKDRIGRIDLLAIGDGQIIILDYKTDRISSLSEVPQEYIHQLSFYQKAIAKIYPNHTVQTQILWLETLEFMNI